MNKKLIISICAVFLFVAVGVGIYLFFNNKKTVDINFDYDNESDVFAVEIPGDFDQFKLTRLEEKKQQALESYRKDKNDTWTWIVIGNFHEYAKNYDRAIRDYEKVLKIDPQEMISISNIANICNNYLDDYTKAEEFYKRALQNSGASYQLYIDLALMYEYKMNQPTLAASTYIDGLKNYPDNSSLIVSLIMFYKRQNDLAEAGKYANMLIKAFPNNQQFREQFGQLIK